MESRRHFSMIRNFHAADWLTLANAVCGAGAILSVVTYVRSGETAHLLGACALVAAALVFDVLDGRVARWRHETSLLGRELDSLADVISFGVAPAAIAFGAGMNGLADGAILLYFVACGVSRLARYNVTAEVLSQGGDKVRHFEGTPIPTSIVLVALVAAAAWSGAVGERLWLGAVHIGSWTLHPLALLYAISGSLMISKTLHIPKL
jgi:CDP-diacylglycerol--serine O-phosphatidyltransferase